MGKFADLGLNSSSVDGGGDRKGSRFEGMNYADIEKGIAALGQKAKNNQIAVEDMDGGTFTIRFELDIARSNSD